MAALMAMRHPKSIVLSGALSALVVMTVLSTGLGRIVPNLISRKHTNSTTTVLYAFFGLRLLYIAWRSTDSKASQKKEIEEAIWLECTQEQNEIIFVPCGWYHQVQNMEDTISINHNWFNACNLSWVWKLLLKDYNEAKEYIEDIKDICDDFEGLCQRNLAANTGMNFTDFFIFITRFTIANLTQLHSLTKDHYKHIYDKSPIVHHLISNLTSIKKVASNMKPMEIFVSGNFNSFLNIEEVMKESEFMRMYSSLGRIYPVLRDLPSKYSSDAEEEAIGVDLKAPYFGIDSSCEISSPDDLIKLIDNVVTNLDKKLGNVLIP